MANSWFSSPSRGRTLLLGVAAGVVYGFLCVMLVSLTHRAVSLSFIFMVPVVLGAIPVLFSSREQLSNYFLYLAAPWLITFTVFALSMVTGFEGLICLVIIIGPFSILGSLGAFLYRLVRLRQRPQTSLYVSLLVLLPFGALLLEEQLVASDQIHTVVSTRLIAAPPAVVWRNIQNVRHIRPSEIKPHFVHLIGVPRPLDGYLDYARVGGTRHIRWEKGLYFQEHITHWQPGRGFAYTIKVDAASIPPSTLDEHVLVGGRYFDVVRGSYSIEPLAANTCRLTLTCTYRITTNLNTYGKLWPIICWATLIP
ncbi:SRPBCC family protein [Hymenobacter cellulosilyticus]|uniref:SRPBCC family protein n=1 Tax=Hymenobacter cellulosilyticus TaxID=2932248 RepID=A0A8T9Q243_9BACT|nr:SRPBCC family protein [Hymenobacter cellulosilyticus]UOQ71115.1 SRPBCC family protein [Hymenobacter cellulosilyticus]